MVKVTPVLLEKSGSDIKAPKWFLILTMSEHGRTKTKGHLRENLLSLTPKNLFDTLGICLTPSEIH
ncbi:MAG: hypothetical protein NPIRA05_12000 [Nitrospirales bacterium]|nr:MAG: hypothetical protein NPIRA05_12000 [Nitrospirales bacterium]